MKSLLPDNISPLIGPSSKRAIVSELAQLALDEGLPVAWIPRSEILDRLIASSTDEARIRILEDHDTQIMEDCKAKLSEIDHEWAQQCLNAVDAYSHGLEEPAQSHASDIIDSVVLAIFGRKGREHVKRAAQKKFNELDGQEVVENLVLRPLVRCYAAWYPGSEKPLPGHFSRHATAHAVGHRDVFSRDKALIAVMVATSLTMQFWDHPKAPRSEAPSAMSWAPSVVRYQCDALVSVAPAVR